MQPLTERFYFPQNLTKKSIIKAFQRSVCRPFTMNYEEEIQVGSFLGYKFRQPDGLCDRKEPPLVYECDRDSKPTIPNGVCDVSKCAFSKFLPYQLTS